MRNIKRQGFTLVELIVVITILAILGSIAFISLQGYSSDARNSKRSSDLNSITSAMSTQLAQGQSIMSFANNTDTLSEVTGLSVGGTGVVAGTDYNAGTINYASLPVKATDFQDPTGVSYVIGVTTRNNGRYELAASVEQGAGSKVAKVSGNYSPRTTVTTKTVATGAILSMVTLSSDADINYFNPGDYVNTVGGTATGRTITKISTDGKTITLSSNVPTTTTGIALAAAEGVALIDAAGATTGNVVDGGSVLPY